jgi:hypothetical protein
MVATGACIQCSTQLPQVFADGFQAQAQLNIALTDIPSTAIRQGVELATSMAKKPVTPHSQRICQCRLADVFVPGDKNAGPLFRLRNPVMRSLVQCLLALERTLMLRLIG